MLYDRLDSSNNNDITDMGSTEQRVNKKKKEIL